MGRRTGRVVAGLVSLVVLTAGAGAQTTSGLEQGLRETQQQRDRTAQDLADRRAEEVDVRTRLEFAQAEHARAEAALAEVEARLADAHAERERATDRAQELRVELAGVEAELTATEVALAEVQVRFDDRVAGAFKRGGTGAETAMVGRLLTQDTIADALATAPFLTAVMDADRRVVDEVNAVREQVVRQRAEAASLRVAGEQEARQAARAAGEVEEQRAAQQRATAELAAQRAKLDAAHDAVVNDRRAVESHLASIDAESDRLEGELQALAEQRAREARERAAQEQAAAEARAREAERQRRAEREQGGSTGAAPSLGAGDRDERGGSARGDEAAPPPTSPPTSSGWSWPAACGRVTSGYGSRSVAGGSRYHRGVDIACTRVLGANPPVSTSRGGIVSPVGCGGGYGVCLIVDHLDGWFSLYAHMSGVAVSPGTSVRAGQVIGYEGSTGNSTGPHLHFEIWDGGTKVDPCPRIGC